MQVPSAWLFWTMMWQVSRAFPWSIWFWRDLTLVNWWVWIIVPVKHHVCIPLVSKQEGYLFETSSISGCRVPFVWNDIYAQLTHIIAEYCRYSNQKNKMPKNCSRLSQIMFPASFPGVQLVDLYVYSAIYINTLRKYYRNTSLNLVLKTRQNLLLLLDGL